MTARFRAGAVPLPICDSCYQSADRSFGNTMVLAVQQWSHVVPPTMCMDSGT